MRYGVRTKGHASLKVGVAKALPQHMRGSILEVSHVRTEPEYRNQGEAKMLMLDVCLDADVDEKFLLVLVEPDSDSPMDLEALTNWYASIGFAPIQAEPLLMVRPHLRAAIVARQKANPVNAVMAVDTKENTSGQVRS